MMEENFKLFRHQWGGGYAYFHNMFTYEHRAYRYRCEKLPKINGWTTEINKHGNFFYSVEHRFAGQIFYMKKLSMNPQASEGEM